MQLPKDGKVIAVGSPGGIDLDDVKAPHVLDPDYMDAIDLALPTDWRC